MATGVTGGDPSKLSKAGGVLTGPLTLPGPPTQPLHAVTKQYVDSRPGGGGSGGYRGAYDPASAYNPGDIVTVGDASYGTATGAAAGVAPVASTELLAAAPANLGSADGTDYELGLRFSVAKRLRLRGLAFYKSALQTQSPHVLKLWDVTVPAAPRLVSSANTVGEAPGASGRQFAPMVVDLLPGRTYIAAEVAGTGSDGGYAITPADAWPKVAGSVTADTAVFSTVVGSMAAPTVTATNFHVWPVWEEPSVDWDLMGRFDPVGV